MYIQTNTKYVYATTVQIFDNLFPGLDKSYIIENIDMELEATNIKKHKQSIF